VEGQLLNNVYIVGENGAALGRHSASNDIVISESFVSRRHSEIKYCPPVQSQASSESNPASEESASSTSKFYLRDIGSTTGTFIMVRNEVMLSKSNMMFQMGLSEFKVVHTSKKSMIELHVFEGPSRNRIITVDEMGLGIGRDQQNSFCVQDDSQMSNFHAKITYFKPNSSPSDRQEGFYLQDVGSTNRTWLRLSAEGEQSNLHPLRVNDIIKIGSTVFVVQSNDIGNLKNMPVINKRVAGGGAANGINFGVA
jgi:pSer/pThr/pTyr-binding forkhead associated (FHA) protein